MTAQQQYDSLKIDIGSGDSDNFPDSICARSRISLISFRRYHPPLRIWSMCAFWERVGGGDSDSIN